MNSRARLAPAALLALLALPAGAAARHVAPVSATAAALSSPAPATATPGVEVYTVLPTSRARFIVHSRSFFAPETVHGRGGTMTGSIRLVPGPSPAVSADLSVTTATLRTGIFLRNSKMRSTLDAGAYPAMDVTITGVGPFREADLDAQGVTVTARGLLTVAGVSVPLSFPVTVHRVGGDVLRISGTAVTGFKALKLKVPGLGFLVKLHDKIEAGADIEAQRAP